MLKDNMNSLILFYIKIRKLLIYINKIKIKGIYINFFKKDFFYEVVLKIF